MRLVWKKLIPSVSTIHRVNKTFDDTGCVPKNVGTRLQEKKTTAENMQIVAEEIFRSPDIPKRHCCPSDTLDISMISLYRIQVTKTKTIHA